jgi:hypothetical protein
MTRHRAHLRLVKQSTLRVNRTRVLLSIALRRKSVILVRSSIVLLLAISAGCQNSSDAIDLSGLVTLDGERLAEGIISFSPSGSDKSGPQSATVETKIADGTYRVSVPRGDKVVSVEAHVPIEGSRALPDDYPGARSTPIAKQIVPAKYNLNSELRYTAETSSSSVDFRLTTH